MMQVQIKQRFVWISNIGTSLQQTTLVPAHNLTDATAWCSPRVGNELCFDGALYQECPVYFHGDGAFESAKFIEDMP